MGGINIRRWLLGGIVASAVIFILEGIASSFYMESMERAMQALGLSMEMSATTWILAITVSLLTGLMLIFFYAAVRPRFGPGPKTAFLVAIALVFAGYLPTLIGYHMMGIFPDDLLLHWLLIGVVEMIVATLAGAWLYREGE